MIPDRYITIPTVLRHIRSRIDQDDVGVLQGNDPEKVAIEFCNRGFGKPLAGRIGCL